MKNQKILITGSNGFIGKHLVRVLEQENEIFTLSPIRSQRIDVTDFESLKSLPIKEIDIVFHLAAHTDIEDSLRDPRRTVFNNCVSTLNILELCRLFEMKLIYMSSYLYGKPQYLPTDESHPLSPTNPYALSKMIAETMCNYYIDNYNIKCITLRPFNVYGIGQPEKKYSVVGIIKQIGKGEVEIENEMEKRDYIYVSDVVDALIKAGHCVERISDVFNIGTGNSYTLPELVTLLLKISGKNPKLTIGRKFSSYIPETRADIGKAEKELDWHPKIDIFTGMKKLWDYYGNKS